MKYMYECRTCGVFEAEQSMKDEAFKTCPQCGGNEIARVITGGAGVIFKGSGFYETDYKKKAPEAPACPSADSGNPGCAGCPGNKVNS